ncbi:MAG: PspC domain-containing protein [Acidimicrobiia bacterium]|nr:PspC domain-containing protein [Acidimicrobiia bacterium]MYC84764.1 PspC domain-containing protein [Acidimicrobiia bacterium]
MGGPTVLARREQNRLVAGVAGGVADRLGVLDLYARAAFLVLALVWGLGILLYLVLWGLTLDQTARPEPVPPADSNRRAAYVLMFIGSLLLLRGLGIWSGDGWVWPGAALSFGTAFLMDRGDIDPRSAILGLFDPDSGRFRARTVIGVVLLLIGVSILANVAAPAVGTVLLAVLITGVGMVVLFGPWVWRLVSDLGAERRRRIRQEARADMAAHLHDSVLQTLALIQRTDDPRRVMTLARVQERELRRWLYDTTPAGGPELLSAALQEEADRIEQTFDIHIQVVTVGDRPVDEGIRATIAATGEALTNAARHSGADRVSVYSEVSQESTDIWISDQGAGFDPEVVAGDRYGIAESIVGRMQSNGGAATVSSAPGEGTEVHLRLGGEPG